MRALPLLMSSVGVMVLSNAIPLGHSSTASALWPLAASLGARAATARVEVFSASTVKKHPSVRILEQEILPGGNWRASKLGTGEVFSAQSGGRSARIAYVPSPAGATLVCSTAVEVPADGIGGALSASSTPPCGPRHEQVTVTATLAAIPSPATVKAALRQVGALQRGLVHGPEGLLALAYVPGTRPAVAIGGVAMNLAVQITYDNAHSPQAVLATPTITESEP